MELLIAIIWALVIFIYYKINFSQIGEVFLAEQGDGIRTLKEYPIPQNSDELRKAAKANDFDLVAIYRQKCFYGFELCFKSEGVKHSLSWNKENKIPFLRVKEDENLDKQDIFSSNAPLKKRKLKIDFTSVSGNLNGRIEKKILKVIDKIEYKNSTSEGSEKNTLKSSKRK